MHLSPIKGAFPHKDQHDRTAPVAVATDSNDIIKIERGTVIRIAEDPVTKEAVFEVAEDASVYPMYLALQRYEDLQAAMAGTFSPANGVPTKWPQGPVKRAVGDYSNKGPLNGGVRPAITGIHMDDGDVWETDMFDETSDWDSAELNAKLTVVNGLIALADSSADDQGIVGFLVKRPYKRYCNDAPAVKDMMTGATRWVIQFQCGK